MIFQDAINTRVPTEMRALFIVFGPMIGAILDTRGPADALRCLGLVYLVGIFVVAWPLLSQRSHFKTSG